MDSNLSLSLEARRAAPPQAPDNEEPDELVTYPLPECTSEGEELERLRVLLFQQERVLLHSLQQRLDDPSLYAKDLSKVIAEALMLRAERDDLLAKTLQPTIESVLRTSVKNNPGELATSLFPLMGPAIRKAIAEGFRSMLQGLNKTLEMAFSWRGLRWRLEALRTGRPFSEIVLLHTLIYQVEQVYLIHTQTGLMLGHAATDEAAGQDADLVSGMLSAIQSFIQDCFAVGNDSLDTLQMGERSLIVEKGSEASLALVVRGTLPYDFRNKIRDILDKIHIECAKAFANFNGDLKPFRAVHYYLEDCLAEHYTEDFKHLPIWVKCLPIALMLLLCGAPSYLWYQNNRFQAAVDVLRAKPGIVVSNARGNALHGWEVSLARDPLALDPYTVIQEAGFDTSRVTLHETPFASLEPSMVETRLKRAMHAPDTVLVKLNNSVLHLEGSAPMDWILSTTEKALGIPGIERVDTSKIADPRTARLAKLIRSVEQSRITFPLGKDTPEGADYVRLASTIVILAELANLATDMGLSPTLIIYGHTDTTGGDKRNYQLSTDRAKTLASMLYSKGVAMPIATYGFGSEHSIQREGETGQEASLSGQQSRRIELKVHLSYLGNSLVSLESLSPQHQSAPDFQTKPQKTEQEALTTPSP